MATQKAIVLQGEPGQVKLVTDRPRPRHRPGYLLVDVKAVALNPTDWKHVDFRNTANCLSGCDYAGVVKETGQGYTKDWKVGDRIAGFCHGGNELEHEDGAFSEVIAAKADIAYKIPDDLSFEDASTLGVALVTVGQGMFQQMELNWPNNPSTSGDFFLVYGGSSAMGTMGIQFGKLAGYRVIATASKHNFDLVKSLGAEEAFDYKDSDVVDQIKKYTNGNLKYIWDTIALPPTAEICAGAISPGGTYGSILQVKFPRDDVKTTFSLGYTAVGEPVKKWNFDYPDTTADFEWMKKFVKEVADPLVAEGRLRVHPPLVTHGLENVFEGFDLMRHDKVSGKKLVYTL